MNDYNAKVKAIKDAIELEVTQDDLEGLQGKLLKCVTLFSLSSELCARTTTDLRNAELKALSEDEDATMFKIKAKTGEAQGRMELADRLNAGLTHCIEALRTMISLKKVEYEKTLNA